jgi:replicative DNA helicase
MVETLSSPSPGVVYLSWAHAMEAEQSVIGGLMLDNSAWDRVGDVVSAADFYSADHRLIFQHIEQLIEQNRPADGLTIAESLRRNGTLSQIDGGQEYLASLALNTPSAANVRRYAEIVRERALFRAIFSECNALIDAVRRPGDRDARQILDMAQARIFSLGERSAGGADFESSQLLMSRVVEFVDAQYQRNQEAGSESAVTGLATGFVDFDRMTSGLHPGQLIVLAARPAMGKSSLALNISEHVARSGVGVAFFSLEMGNKEQGIRLVASGARLNTQRLFSGRISEQEWPRVVDSVGKLIELPLFFNESPYLGVMEMRALSRRLKRQQPGLGLVVLDYLQLMVAGGNEQNRANQIAEISRGLKLLAKELQLPVIALAQLNRELEKRTNKRPMLSDLRDSGAIEQDADVVVFIHRDEAFQPTPENRGHAELIVAKQRNGPVGSVDLRFRADNTTFENWS